MNNKQYQIKDIIDKFYISRDTVKYFEKKGLITSKRNESGYRVYDEIDMQIIKRILDLRELGYSFEEIKEIKDDSSLEKELDTLKKLRESTEKTVSALNKKLEKIGLYEQFLCEKHIFWNQIKQDTDFRICIPDSKEYTTGSVREFLVRDMKYALLSQNGEIVSMEDKKIVRLKGKNWMQRCMDCKLGTKIEYETVFRGVRICDTKEELQRFIKQIYGKAVSMGFSPKMEAYCAKIIVKLEGKDYIAYDVSVPIEE